VSADADGVAGVAASTEEVLRRVLLVADASPEVSALVVATPLRVTAAADE
jgi:hypothetical protein